MVTASDDSRPMCANNPDQLFGVGALAHRGLPPLHRGLVRGSFPAPHHHDPNETLPNFQIWVHGGLIRSRLLNGSDRVVRSPSGSGNSPGDSYRHGLRREQCNSQSMTLFDVAASLVLTVAAAAFLGLDVAASLMLSCCGSRISRVNDVAASLIASCCGRGN